MKKLTGILLVAAITLSPASPAFAEKSKDRQEKDRSSQRSSCTLDVGALTRNVNVQAFCGSGRTDSKNSQPSSACGVDLGALTTVELKALCASDRAQRDNERRAQREDDRGIQLSSCIALGVLQRSISLQALCEGR